MKRSQAGSQATHIEFGLTPADNGSQGRLLEHETYTVKINFKMLRKNQNCKRKEL